MSEHDKPSADERDAIKREFFHRLNEDGLASGIGVIADMVLAARRDADRRVEEALLALSVIAEMPLSEQDNMVAANMRRIAVGALAAQAAATGALGSESRDDG